MTDTTSDDALDMRSLAAIESDLTAADAALQAARSAIASAQDQEASAIAAVNALQDELTARVTDMRKMSAIGTNWAADLGKMPNG